jgi:hypothetical protein
LAVRLGLARFTFGQDLSSGRYYWAAHKKSGGVRVPRIFAAQSVSPPPHAR